MLSVVQGYHGKTLPVLYLRRTIIFIIAVSPTSVVAVKCLLATVSLLLTSGLRSLWLRSRGSVCKGFKVDLQISQPGRISIS